MRKLYLCLSLYVLVGVVSCDKDNGANSNEDTPTVIMPLSIVNSWSFERLILGKPGDTLSIDTEFVVVSADTTIESER